MTIKAFSILLILALAFVPIASATNPVTATSGDTWIKFSWSGNSSTYNLYLDGRLVENSTPLTYYLISDLPADEKHILEVRNASSNALVGTATASTLPAAGTTIFLLVVQLALMFLVFASRDVSFGILTGGASYVIGGYILLSGASQFWAVLISLVLLILTGLAVIRLMYESVSSKNWW